MTRGAMAGVAMVAMLAGLGNAAAEPTDRPIAAAVARLSVAPDRAAAMGGDALTLKDGAADEARLQRAGYPGPAVRESRGKRVGRAIAGAAVGAVGGAFAGGYLGAKLEPNCSCDDPGLKGFLIGFPVGGVVGGVLGGLYLFR
jgi:hypothetical protein